MHKLIVAAFGPWCALLLLLLLLLLLPATGARAVSIASVSPQGEAAQVRQVRVRFSEAMVPFGDLRQPDPATLRCQGKPAAGTSRWIDDRTWVHDFGDALPPGTRCTLTAKASSGALTGKTEFGFSTGGPAVLSIQPSDGAQQIDEQQYFLLRLSGPAVEASVTANAWCEVEGIGERLPLRVIGGEPRAELLKARRITDAAQAGRTLIVTCQRPLPNTAALRLVWGKGIAAAANPAVTTGVEQRYRFQVRPAFTAEFNCERERATAPCLPIRPLGLRFSAPVGRELAAQIRLRPARGEALAPVLDKDDKDDKNADVSAIVFLTPLAENTAFTIELPQGLKDNAGRRLANASAFPLKVATGDAPPIAKFAAAPFGVVEHGADAVLPVTLRHVQGDLRPAAASGQVRVRRLQTDAEILQWYARLRKYDETRLTARELGLPSSQWYSFDETTDARGRKIRQRSERYVGTREVSLLNTDPAARRLELPQLAAGDPRPFEVIGIPLPEAGYHVVEIESGRLGAALLDKRAPMFVRTGVLVTNLGVHFKHGRENSVAWVTSLDRGKPVEGAAVVVNDCNGKPLWSGTTDAQGLARVPLALDPQASSECVADDGLFVTARKALAAGGGGNVDTAFVFGSWQKGIESWRFDLPTGRGATPDAQARTLLDRTLLRAGETVSMKHFFRIETSAGLGNARPEQLPTRLKIVHEGSGQEFVQPLAWSAGGRSAVSTWNIPPAARLGVYNLVMERASAASGADPEANAREWNSGDFRVEEFRVPLVDARISGPKTVAVAPVELPLAVQLNYLSGGGMARAPAHATALLKRRAAGFAGHEDFSFEPPRQPRQADAGGAADDTDTDGDGGDEADTAAADTGRLVADKLPLVTDANGAASVVLKDLPKITEPSELTAEVAFNDPNGEVQTASTTVALWPSAVVLGVKTGRWVSHRGRAGFSVLALDTSGRPLQGQRVEVRGRLSQTISTRKRMVGGFYAYDNRTETKDLGALCGGRTDARGLLACDAMLDAAGEVELIASAADAQGNVAQAASSIWVTKQGELWFAQDNDDRIDVLPEKRRYEPGETARLQVRMPFREASALVAVEREGVIDTRVVTLRGNDPTIEVKIEANWGPNVYVSVLALRGRIRETPWYSFFSWGWKEPLGWGRSVWSNLTQGSEHRAPTALVDLARPAFKLGVAALKVGVAAHELQVSVTADKPQYEVRQKAVARIKVGHAGNKPPAGTEVAFAAVDEGLLALRPNDSWDLLGAMLQTRAWGVETSTAQSEIIGRRHYGRKAVAAGGGGGGSATRELFDTLLLWRARVALDANGEAVIEVPLNDSLTSFRLVAIADDGAQRFGTGSTSIRVTQDLQLLSGLPPLVREGDSFSAMLTLRNTTARPMKVRASLRGVVAVGNVNANTNVNASASASAGSQPGPAPLLDLPPRDVEIAAGAAAELVWPVEVPADAISIAWEGGADEQGGGRASDRLKLTQRVAAAVPVRVLQASLQQLDGGTGFSVPVAAPADALSTTAGVRRGGIEVALQPSLSGALPGIRRYFETYPFVCLEQKFSKAVGLKDAALWAGVVDVLPTYLDADGLAGYFPPRADEGARGSDRLTAYLVAASHEAGFELPAPAREAMLAGLAAFVDGRIERKTWSPRPDLDVRKLAAIEALSRHGKAQARMLGSVNLTPGLWPTAALIDWFNILRRVDGIPNRAARLAEAGQLLRSRLTYAGTTLNFSTEEGDFWWWLMDSADANAARLILAVADDPAWRDEVPRMVVGALGRQRGGAWLTTTANLWGALALDRFSASFESAKVGGRSVATLGDRSASVDWSRSAAGGSMQLGWPAQAGMLNVTQQGDGKPWLTLRSLAAVALQGPLRAGYGIERSIVAVGRETGPKDKAAKDKAGWSRGDVLRVRLTIDAQSDMSWVVVSDPVPGGATILGSGLGRDSAVATRGETRAGRAWPVFEERAFEAYRGYFEFMPRGRHVVEYTIRLNNPGRFALPPTRVEAMYAPESFGEVPNAALVVGP